MITKNMNYDHFQRGEYQVADKVIYFRSKWEYWYCLYLEFLKKNHEIRDYQYEPFFLEFPIKHGTTRYLPDFIVETNQGKYEIHEVKGYMTSKAKTQLKRVAKYYSQYKIKMIDKDFFKAIKKKKQEKLLGWN